MAVKNEGDIYPTEELFSPKNRKHYRIPVRSQHWQLRSLVSAEKQDIVYFPGGHGSNHVQRLNTTTNECETIKLLTFAPRCLVAENGWLCCGGESGEFVAFRLDENDVDPQDESVLESSAHTVLNLISRGQWPEKSLVAKSMKLAKDRVNCITLWFPPTTIPASDKAYTEPVAILANNDRTVTLVSLQEFDQKDKTEALDILTFPDYVNRALISPDGSILVAILDDPYLYVHERVNNSRMNHAVSSSGEVAYGWKYRQRIILKSQRKDDNSDSRGSFAACFSNSGAYLAVGTQHGTISIFNTNLLCNSAANPLITTFQSSRPLSGPGAIRDMAFCPGPYDILAWTEDRGVVGVTDVRSHFVVRQIIDINDAKFEHVQILDRHTIDPRLLENRNDRGDSGLASALGTNLNLAGRSRRGAGTLDSLNSPLTANETLVLDAMQSDRRRRERLGQRSAVPGDRSTDTSTTSWGDRTARQAASRDSDTPRASERRSASIGRALGDSLPSYRDQRERIQDRVRISRALLRDAADSQGYSRRPEQRWIESLGDTVAAIRNQSEHPSYLTILEFLQARDRAPGESARDRDQDDAALLVPLVNQVVTRLEENAIRGNLAPDHGVFEVPPSPDNTAGLAWSEDGRILYVGAQNGIYELHVNVQGRKFSPSITMR